MLNEPAKSPIGPRVRMLTYLLVLVGMLVVLVCCSVIYLMQDDNSINSAPPLKAAFYIMVSLILGLVIFELLILIFAHIVFLFNSRVPVEILLIRAKSGLPPPVFKLIAPMYYLYVPVALRAATVPIRND